MRHVLVAFGMALLVAGGCRSTGKAASVNEAPVGVARPVIGWDDVDSVFRDGQFYFASQPQESALRRFAADGVTVVVNLRGPSEMESLEFDEPAAVESLDMEYVTIPISPDSFSAKDVNRLTEVLSETSGPVLIHCSSSNRVGGLWAAYLVRVRGMDVEDAIERGKAAGLRKEPMLEATTRVAREP